MRAQTGRIFTFALLSAAGLSFVISPNMTAAENDAPVMLADRAFVQAAAKGDTEALGKMLDAEFTWTNTEGKTLMGEEVLRVVPKDALGDESGVEVSERTYGQV